MRQTRGGTAAKVSAFRKDVGDLYPSAQDVGFQLVFHFCNCWVSDAVLEHRYRV